MRIVKWVVLSSLLLVPLVFTNVPIGAQSEDSEGTLKRIVDDWAQVPVNKNFSLLDKILADDYVGTSPSGHLRTKSELIALHKNDPSTYTATGNEEVSIHKIAKDVAVVTGRYADQGQDKDGKQFTRCYRFTDVFVSRNGSWQCVASQTNLLVTTQK